MFQIMSDLHIEKDTATPSTSSLIVPSAPVLILAGDIGHFYKYDQLKEFLVDVASKFEVVVYVLGNHEFYREKDIPEISMDEIVTQMKALASEIGNMHILNRDSIRIGDVCISGCTLWSQAINIPPYIVRINGMNLQKYNEMHRKDLQYINGMIKYCQRENLKLVVVTHHCPSYSVVKKKRFTSLYASNLDILLDSASIHTWICGHNHSNFDFVTPNGTRLVSNQRGKPNDKINDFSLRKLLLV